MIKNDLDMKHALNIIKAGIIAESSAEETISELIDAGYVDLEKSYEIELKERNEI